MSSETIHLKKNPDKENNKHEIINKIPALRNWISIGVGSFGVKNCLLRVKTAYYTNQMDFLGCYASDFEKIKLDQLNEIKSGFFERVFKSKEPVKFNPYQLDFVQMGMGGEIKNAWDRLDETTNVVKRIIEEMEKDTSKYANHVGVCDSNNSRCGGSGPVVGMLLESKMRFSLDIDVMIENTVLPIEADRIKYDNRKITLANQIKHGFPGKDLIFLTDNTTTRHGITRDQMDIMNAIIFEGFKNGESIKGHNDLSDRIGTLKEDGNGFVLPAAIIRAIPINKILFGKKQIIGPILSDTLKSNLSNLCKEEGFQKNGFVRARKTKPEFLVICGDIPKEIAEEAANSSSLPPDVSVLFLPTSFLGERMLIGAIHVTKNSIDSIDRIFGINPNGTRPASSPEKLLPEEIIEEYAEKEFPRSKISYPMIYERVARICDCDVEEVMEVA